MKVAVAGAEGRLGRALMRALEDAPFTGPFGPTGWYQPDFDLDDPGAAARVVARDRPEVVIHAAAWTDVDGCARDPECAMRRNATAVGEMADACLRAGADMLLLSTNEVFDGERDPAIGYAPGDPTGPLQPVWREQARGGGGRARSLGDGRRARGGGPRWPARPGR